MPTGLSPSEIESSSNAELLKTVLNFEWLRDALSASSASGRAKTKLDLDALFADSGDYEKEIPEATGFTFADWLFSKVNFNNALSNAVNNNQELKNSITQAVSDALISSDELSNRLKAALNIRVPISGYIYIPQYTTVFNPDGTVKSCTKDKNTRRLNSDVIKANGGYGKLYLANDDVITIKRKENYKKDGTYYTTHTARISVTNLKAVLKSSTKILSSSRRTAWVQQISDWSSTNQLETGDIQLFEEFGTPMHLPSAVENGQRYYTHNGVRIYFYYTNEDAKDLDGNVAPIIDSPVLIDMDLEGTWKTKDRVLFVYTTNNVNVTRPEVNAKLGDDHPTFRKLAEKKLLDPTTLPESYKNNLDQTAPDAYLVSCNWGRETDIAFRTIDRAGKFFLNNYSYNTRNASLIIVGNNYYDTNLKKNQPAKYIESVGLGDMDTNTGRMIIRPEWTRQSTNSLTAEEWLAVGFGSGSERDVFSTKPTRFDEYSREKRIFYRENTSGNRYNKDIYTYDNVIIERDDAFINSDYFKSNEGQFAKTGYCFFSASNALALSKGMYDLESLWIRHIGRVRDPNASYNDCYPNCFYTGSNADVQCYNMEFDYISKSHTPFLGTHAKQLKIQRIYSSCIHIVSGSSCYFSTGPLYARMEKSIDDISDYDNTQKGYDGCKDLDREIIFFVEMNAMMRFHHSTNCYSAVARYVSGECRRLYSSTWWSKMNSYGQGPYYANVQVEKGKSLKLSTIYVSERYSYISFNSDYFKVADNRSKINGETVMTPRATNHSGGYTFSNSVEDGSYIRSL